MPKLPRITGVELVYALEKAGFVIVRQKGSHLRMKHPDNRVVSIPVHTGQILGKGLMIKIIRDAELTKAELIDLLKS